MLLALAVAPEADACPNPVAAGFQGPSYPSGTGANSEVTAEKPESKLWFHDGSWWGSLWSTSGNAYHVHRLDPASSCWEDTGVVLDPRQDSKADVLLHGQTLYVVSHLWDGTGQPAPPGQRGELFRYGYDAASRRWTPHAGFPVEVNDSEGEALTIARDSSGRLWVSYVESQRVMLNHTRCTRTCDDRDWSSPFVLPTANADNLTSDDLSAVVAYDGHVGVLWSNQSRKQMYFAAHADAQAPDSGWAEVSAYALSADDHINLKALESDPAGKVFAAIKTSRSADLIVLLVCERGDCTGPSDWQAHTVYDGSFSPTRPILLLDVDHREAYVAVRHKIGGNDREIHSKKTDLDAPDFSIGDVGDRIIATAQIDDINDPTSTKSNLTSASGLVVLASDSSDRDYYTSRLPFGGPRIDAFTPTQGPPGTQVTIAGAGLAGAVQVTFAGTDAAFLVDSDQQVRATVPAGASTGPLRVTTGEGSATGATDFIVSVPSYSLTIEPTQGGSVASDPPGGSHPGDTVVTLTARPDLGFSFDGWNGDLDGLANPTTLLMDADKTVSASFGALPPGSFVLELAVVGAGSVGLDPPGPTYADGTLVTLTATPHPGSSFVSWSGDLSGPDTSTTLLMDGHKRVTAQFAREFHLDVTTVGAGSVGLDPSGPTYLEGSVVTLTALPDSGLQFAGWSGDLTGAGNPETLTMDADKTVTATFALPGVGLEFQEAVTGTSFASSSVTTSAGVGAGNSQLYLAAVTSKPHESTLSVSGLGLAWTQLVDQCAGRSQTGISLWLAQGSPAAAGPVTATLAEAPKASVLAVARYSGADATAALGDLVSANTNGLSGACDAGVDGATYSVPITTGVADALVFGAAALRSKSHEPGVDWSERVEVVAGSGGDAAGLALADREFAGAGPAAFSGSFGDTVDWAVAAVELRPQLLPPTTTTTTTAPPTTTSSTSTTTTTTAQPTTTSSTSTTTTTAPPTTTTSTSTTTTTAPPTTTSSTSTTTTTTTTAQPTTTTSTSTTTTTTLPPEPTECSDGLDNDGDGWIDLEDPGCDAASDPSEHSPLLECDDGVDNDGDSRADLDDPGCDDPADPSEKSSELVCDDGVDNDLDGLVDYPADAGCKNPMSGPEDPACDDDLDNDGDGTVDWDGGSAGAEPDARCRQPWKDRE